MSIEKFDQKVVSIFKFLPTLAGTSQGYGCDKKTLARIQGVVMLEEGESYVPIFRSLLKHRYMEDANKLQFWLWCLLKATYKEHKVLIGNKTVTLHPGQFIFGRKAAAKELGSTEQQIRTILKFFSSKAEQKLTIKSTKQFSIITVIDYASYIDKAKQANQRINQQPTNDQPTPNHKQEGVKKVKNKTYKGFSLPSWVPEEEWSSYVEMRDKIKKPMTDKAKAMAVKELEKLKDQGDSPAEVLNQSVFNAWQGLFKIKDKQPAASNLKLVAGYVVK